MTCNEIERDDIAERYLLRHLSDDEQERFEAHYFECARCLQRVRVLEESRAMLSREATSSPAMAESRLHAEASGRGAYRRWRGAAAVLAAAALVFVAVRVVQDSATTDVADEREVATARAEDVRLPGPSSQIPTPTESLLAKLSTIEPPSYSPMRLRGSATDAQREFRAAMALYIEQDYAGAAAGIRRAIALDDALLQAHFYLAICELQMQRTPQAVHELQRVITAGESVYLEDAHFFIAKAHIRQGELRAARAQLERVVALKGDRLEQARQLLAQLP